MTTQEQHDRAIRNRLALAPSAMRQMSLDELAVCPICRRVCESWYIVDRAYCSAECARSAPTIEEMLAKMKGVD